MEGGANPKKMARSKRASSQRSRAKHSRHGGVPAVTREKAVSEGLLSHNWERYESGSDDDDVVGEVRPKSKRANYSELLSSDMPRLFEDPPEPGGMMAMLLANGLGLWDWDSSYLEPASSTSERQAAREASALLTVDLRLLGKSIGRLNVAQRLFLEEELFAKQDHVDERVEMMDTAKRFSGLESDDAAVKDEFVHEDDASWDSRDSSGNVQVNVEFPPLADSSGTTLFGNPGLDYCGDIEPGRVSTATTENMCSTKSRLANRDEWVTTSSRTVNSIREPTNEMKEEKEILGEPFRLKKFQATTAEAELDDLLNMLDNQAPGISLNKGNQDDLLKSSQSSNFVSPANPISSRPFNPGFPDSWAESIPRQVAPESELGTALKDTTLPSATGKKVEDIPWSDAKGTDILLSQDDDFDSWLDSI